jgi:hypothetical protein
MIVKIEHIDYETRKDSLHNNQKSDPSGTVSTVSDSDYIQTDSYLGEYKLLCNSIGLLDNLGPTS